MSAPGAWVELRVDAPRGWEELVAETLTDATGGGASVGDLHRGDARATSGRVSVRAYVREVEATPELRATLDARLAGLARATGAEELRDLALDARTLPPEDWATSWQKVWRPFRVGRVCVQRPGAPPPPRADDLALVLEPGGVFGSGRHATTRACLAALQRLVRPGDALLDAGTGTGILAVAAARLGAARALGFDVDPDSRAAAERLAADNGVAERCAFRVGDFAVLRADDGPFDGVVANIYADVVQAHAAELRARLAPGGWFLVSGVHERKADATRAALEDAGLDVRHAASRGRWHTFDGVRAERAAPK